MKSKLFELNSCNILYSLTVYINKIIRFVKIQVMKKCYVVTIVLFVFSVMLTSCHKEAAIKEVKLCNNPSGNQCTEDMTEFLGVETDTVHLYASIANASENVKVEVSWFYQGTDKDKEEIMRGSFDGDENSTIHSMLYLNTPGWPVGEYSVILQIAGSKSDPVEKKFKIE